MTILIVLYHPVADIPQNTGFIVPKYDIHCIYSPVEPIKNIGKPLVMASNGKQVRSAWDQEMFTIMLIEDNANFRQIMKGILQSQFSSIRIVESENWVEALKQIASGPPDLIFMDVKLPTLSGLELTNKIKADHPGVVIVILTAYDFPEYREAAARYKADYFFLKGEMTAGKIVELVNSILSKKEVEMGTSNC